MTDPALWSSVAQFIGRESLYLDAADWDSWLGLYAPDAEYWVPAWDDDGEMTVDPRREISLIYYSNRGGLEDRVFRIRTGKSAASRPTRTCHVSQLLAVSEQNQAVLAKTNWHALSYRDGQARQFFGQAEYLLSRQAEGWVIRRKKTVVLNDCIDVVMDVYSI